MDINEFRRSLTDRQLKSFLALLDEAKKNAGWYEKNSIAYNKSMKLYYEGLDRHKEEIQEVEAEFDLLQARHRQIQEQLHKEWQEALKTKEAKMEAIKKTAWDEDKEAREQIEAERGDSRAELQIIEQMVMAQYQAKLAKKAAKVAS